MPPLRGLTSSTMGALDASLFAARAALLWALCLAQSRPRLEPCGKTPGKDPIVIATEQKLARRLQRESMQRSGIAVALCDGGIALMPLLIARIHIMIAVLSVVREIDTILAQVAFFYFRLVELMIVGLFQSARVRGIAPGNVRLFPPLVGPGTLQVGADGVPVMVDVPLVGTDIRIVVTDVAVIMLNLTVFMVDSGIVLVDPVNDGRLCKSACPGEGNQTGKQKQCRFHKNDPVKVYERSAVHSALLIRNNACVAGQMTSLRG